MDLIGILKTSVPIFFCHNTAVRQHIKLTYNLPEDKVFIFMDVPDGMDSECFDMFRKLLLHCEKCGFLVLFSFNEVLLEAEDGKMKAQEFMLKQCVEKSIPLHSVFDKSISDLALEMLRG